MNRLVEQLSSEFLPAGDSHVAAGSRRSSGPRPHSGGASRHPAGGSASPGRARIVLACAQCGSRNYRKTKARREGASPLALSKFCNTCNAHTQHREAV